MTDIANVTPLTAGRPSEPFTVNEIDTHPDSGHIWASIKAVRGFYDEQIEKLEAEIEALRARVDG